ncbi:hypothetical protein [Helicobacter pylori]|uniref:hypothetical protein n=1 Tax=Helicobacter pylori TaxID=210 RepID=UPI002738E761|nr:hypothetical protein [Helicobacter pylori]
MLKGHKKFYFPRYSSFGYSCEIRPFESHRKVKDFLKSFYNKEYEKIAEHYRKGIGVKKDLRKAKKYFFKDKEQKDFLDKKETKEREESTKLKIATLKNKLEKEPHDTEILLELGEIYARDLKDYKLAMECFKQALPILEKEPKDDYKLACAYETVASYGAKKLDINECDKEKQPDFNKLALERYQKGAELNNAPCCVALANRYENTFYFCENKPISDALKKAKKMLFYYHKARDLGSIEGLNGLIGIYRYGLIYDVRKIKSKVIIPKNTPKAIEYLKEALSLSGSERKADYYHALGRIYSYKKNKKILDYDKALEYFYKELEYRPKTLRSYWDACLLEIAQIYRKKGDLKKFLELNLEVLAFYNTHQYFKRLGSKRRYLERYYSNQKGFANPLGHIISLCHKLGQNTDIVITYLEGAANRFDFLYHKFLGEIFEYAKGVEMDLKKALFYYQQGIRTFCELKERKKLQACEKRVLEKIKQYKGQ